MEKSVRKKALETLKKGGKKESLANQKPERKLQKWKRQKRAINGLDFLQKGFP